MHVHDSPGSCLAFLCRPPHLMLSSALCFVFLFSGYCGLAASPEVVTTCLSTMLRSFGSSVLWVYSTLLLQLRVPDGLLGRMLALEVAFFTVRRFPFRCNISTGSLPSTGLLSPVSGGSPMSDESKNSPFEAQSSGLARAFMVRSGNCHDLCCLKSYLLISDSSQSES